MQIIDIHSHVLPGLDDGSGSMRESVAMIRQAVRQGITGFIATPHYSGTWQNTCPDKIRMLSRKVQRRASEVLETQIRVWPGQEIMYSEEVPGLLEKGEILTMADTRYVLIEFLPSVPYSYIYRAVRELAFAGYRPILAHAERYAALRNTERAAEIKEQGAYIQLNYRTIGGKWYADSTRWSRKMLTDSLVDFLGTDMHNTSVRKPETDAALSWMETHLHTQYIAGITRRNAREMLTHRRAPRERTAKRIT